VFLPRNNLAPRETNLAFILNRRQFPLTSVCCITMKRKGTKVIERKKRGGYG
jgi:hypothetical protein